MRQTIIFQFASFSKEDQKIIKKIVDKRLIKAGKKPKDLSIKITCFSNHFISVNDLDLSLGAVNFLKSLKIETLDQLVNAFKPEALETSKRIKKNILLEIEQLLTEKGLL